MDSTSYVRVYFLAIDKNQEIGVQKENVDKSIDVNRELTVVDTNDGDKNGENWKYE